MPISKWFKFGFLYWEKIGPVAEAIVGGCCGCRIVDALVGLG